MTRIKHYLARFTHRLPAVSSIRLSVVSLVLLLLLTLAGCPGEDPNPQVFAEGCEDCHQTAFREAMDPVHVDVYPERCVACHNNITWAPEDNSGHDTYIFPIAAGNHSGIECAECHPPPSNTLNFTCTDCHEHEQPDMDDEHRGVGGYRYLSSSCLDCHPTGGE